MRDLVWSSQAREGKKGERKKEKGTVLCCYPFLVVTGEREKEKGIVLAFYPLGAATFFISSVQPNILKGPEKKFRQKLLMFTTRYFDFSKTKIKSAQ